MRAKLNQSWPRAGVPPAFASWRDLAEFAVWARDGGALPDTSHQWWDLRLSGTHGTIEVRVADTQTRVDDAATLIAFVQSLVGDLAAATTPARPCRHTARSGSWRTSGSRPATASAAI